MKNRVAFNSKMKNSGLRFKALSKSQPKRIQDPLISNTVGLNDTSVYKSEHSLLYDDSEIFDDEEPSKYKAIQIQNLKIQEAKMMNSKETFAKSLYEKNHFEKINLSEEESPDIEDSYSESNRNSDIGEENSSDYRYNKSVHT